MKVINVRFEDIITPYNATIKNAMRIIDRVGLRIAYVVGENKKLIGIVSDSEIRKAILKGIDIKSPVKNIVNQNPIVLKNKILSNPYSVRKILRNLMDKMPDSSHVLIVDDEDIPKDIVPIYTLMGKEKSNGKKIYTRNKNILIVGGAGYLGIVLTKKLIRRGYKVKVLDILMYGSDYLNDLIRHHSYELIEGDVRNISTLVNALQNIDSVINLAAVVGDPACKNKPEATIETNYLANNALADACRYHQINRFIFASTCSVYGQMESSNVLDENSPLNPVSLYARSKIQSEEGIMNLVDENFSPTILRMGTLYGYSPRMRFDLVVNAMTKTAVVHEKINVFNGGKQWRPLLNIEDAANAFIKCLEASINKIKGEIFNVGSSKQNYRIIEIARIVKKCLPKSKLIIEHANSDPRNYVVSFSKIEKTMSFKANNELIGSINKIVRMINKGYIKDVEDPRYYNIEN